MYLRTKVVIIGGLPPSYRVKNRAKFSVRKSTFSRVVSLTAMCAVVKEHREDVDVQVESN